MLNKSYVRVFEIYRSLIADNGNCGYILTVVTSKIAFNTELYTSVGGRLRGSLDHGRKHLDQTVEIAKTKVLPLLADLKI